MLTLRAALSEATAQLGQNDSAAFDAQLLLAHVLGKSRSWLYTWPSYELDAVQRNDFATLVERAASGVPVAYLIGTRAFWTLTVTVTPAVLIPRPETELLVEVALEVGVASTGPVVDLGTGSGAIALALASERSDWQLYATDASEAALQVARSNATRLGFANVQFLLGSWCDALPLPQYAMIVSNPPYIDETDIHLLALAHEPRAALVAGEAGLADIRKIATQARSKLQQGGWLLLEHGWQQGMAVRQLLESLGYSAVSSRRDIGGHERVTLAQWPES